MAEVQHQHGCDGGRRLFTRLSDLFSHPPFRQPHGLQPTTSVSLEFATPLPAYQCFETASHTCPLKATSHFASLRFPCSCSARPLGSSCPHSNHLTRPVCLSPWSFGRIVPLPAVYLHPEFETVRNCLRRLADLLSIPRPPPKPCSTLVHPPFPSEIDDRDAIKAIDALVEQAGRRFSKGKCHSLRVFLRDYCRDANNHDMPKDVMTCRLCTFVDLKSTSSQS